MKNPYIKSPLNYMGGKHKILPIIIPIMQQESINKFYDVFAGGFNVGLNMECKSIFCNDQIGFLIDMYKMLSKITFKEMVAQIHSLIEKYNLSKTNANGYYNLRENYNKTGNLIELFVLSCFSFNHQIRFNNKHKFNTPFGKNRSSYNQNIEKNLERFMGALHTKDIQYSTMDFRELDYSRITPQDFVYFDPPYLISTGTYNDGKRGFKDWGEKEEIALLDILDSLNARNIKFALSNVMHNKGLSNSLLIEWAKSYSVHMINNSFTNCSYHYKDRTSETVEVLVTNY